MLFDVTCLYTMGKNGEISVAFVCLGNICRSPMAEAVFQHAVNTSGLADVVTRVESFGTAGYHIGETPDSRTVETCKAHKVPIKHHAQQFTSAKFAEFDYVLCMDHSNMKNLKRIEPANSRAKLALFGEWKEEPMSRIIDDPYYGGSEGFETCYDQCVHFSQVFLKTECGLEV